MDESERDQIYSARCILQEHVLPYLNFMAGLCALHSADIADTKALVALMCAENVKVGDLLCQIVL